MTELLVVMGVMGILTSLLIPAVSYGKFRARVAGCSNNYRQFVLAAVLYADSDALGRLPAYSLPTESSQLVNFRSLNPWLVGLPMLSAMEAHGIREPRMWYCPLRKSWEDTSAIFRAVLGRPLMTIDDFAKFYTEVQKARRYASVDLNWWVPRPLEGAPNLTYPDVSLLTTRLRTPWPSKMDDLTLSTRPIVSDWMTGTKKTSNDGFASASGAHVFGGRIRTCNSGYADGHVETRSAENIRWELQMSVQGDGSYVFY